MHIISVSTQYLCTFADHFWFSLPCFRSVFRSVFRSSSFSDSLESSSNHSCSDTPGLLVLLPTSASPLSLVVAMRMVATAHAYYNVQYRRIIARLLYGTLILRTLRI